MGRLRTTFTRSPLPPSDYIDEVFPGGSYWPEDPYRRAMARLFVNDFGNDVSLNCINFVEEGV